MLGRHLRDLPDIRYWFIKDDGQRQFALVVAGSNGEAVSKVAAGITSDAKRVVAKDGSAMLANVVSTAELDRPELLITPRLDVAADLGVSTDQISEAVRVATIGDVSANLARIELDDRQIPIRVQLDERARTNRRLSRH